MKCCNDVAEHCIVPQALAENEMVAKTWELNSGLSRNRIVRIERVQVRVELLHLW